MYALSLLVFNHEFEFQDSVCNGCHDLTMLFLNISNIAIMAVKRLDYLCVIHDIRKSETIHLLENYLLEDHGYILKIQSTIIHVIFWFGVIDLNNAKHLKEI